MSSSYKCSACGGSASYSSRAAAAEAGYTFVEINEPHRVRYYVLCKCVKPIVWLTKTLGEEAKRKD